MKAILVGVEFNTEKHSLPWSMDDSLKELSLLCQTLGYEVVGSVTQKKDTPYPATLIGKGKLDEINTLIKGHGADTVIFDTEITANQQKNIKKAIEGKNVLDRTTIILEIFSEHAKTQEAKVQVEIARLKYQMSHLAGAWTHLERQRGGIGMKGVGEKQIELDRRLIRNRISTLEDKLSHITQDRSIRRKQRSNVLQVAICGYTNAGKSTLLNALTKSHVLSEDKLFATLDPNSKSLNPTSKPPIVITDTVGFISKLPTDLVASFRATLEEILEADLILHVVDASHPNSKEQMEITDKVLNEIGCHDIPQIIVFNKLDAVEDEVFLKIQMRAMKSESIAVSAMTGKNLEELRNKIMFFFEKNLTTYERMVPYEHSEIEAKIHEHAMIVKKTYLEKGVFIRFKADPAIAAKFNLIN